MDKANSIALQFQNWIINFGPKLVSALLVFIIGLTIINWAARLAARSMKSAGVNFTA